MPPDRENSGLEIRMRDPLAEFLGSVPEGHLFRYRLEDLIPLTGHLCPTVTGAFLAARCGISALYGEEPGLRGEILIDIPGTVTDGSNGPITQVFTFLTGAAAENGFGGLSGHYRRRGLLRFHPDDLRPWTFMFSRADIHSAYKVSVDLSRVPPDPEMGVQLQSVMGHPGADRTLFQKLWNLRILKLVELEREVPGSIARAERVTLNAGAIS